jgi:hypothetical protein
MFVQVVLAAAVVTKAGKGTFTDKKKKKKKKKISTLSLSSTEHTQR